MTDQLNCEWAREAIPDLVSGRIAGDEADRLERHLAACGECRAEAELASLIHASPPEVPQGLAARIETSVRLRRAAPTRPWWGLSAAAVAVLALGIGVQSQRGGSDELVVPGFAATESEEALWLSEDGLIAGAPALDGLSEEALLTLLEEMEGGGAA